MKVNGFNGVLFSHLNKMKPEKKSFLGKRKVGNILIQTILFSNIYDKKS